MAIKANLNMIHTSITDVSLAIEQGWHLVKLEPIKAAVHWPDVHIWCINKFGQHNYTHWGAEFYFRNEADAILFALKYR